MGGDLPALELDEPPPPPAPVAPPPEALPDGEAPEAGTPEAELAALGISPAEVRACANYGEVPQSPVQVVPYAILVFSRRRELQELAASLANRHSAAAKRARALLAAYGRALLPRRTEVENAGLGSYLAAVDGVLGDTAAQEAKLAQAKQAADTERSAAHAALKAAEAEAAPLRDRDAKLTKEVEVLTHEKRRRDAALQRAEIELRNLGGDPSARSQVAPKVDAARADAGVITQQLADKTAQLEEVRAALATQLQALERAQRTVSELERDLTGSIQRAGDAHGASRGRAEEVLEALAGAALAAGLQDGSKEAADARKAMEHRDHLQREALLHEHAVDAFDRPKAIQGFAVLGTVALALLIVLLLIIF